MKLYGFVFALFLMTGLVKASDASSQALRDRNETLARLEQLSNKTACGEKYKRFATPTPEQQKEAREALMKEVQNAPKKAER